LTDLNIDRLAWLAYRSHLGFDKKPGIKDLSGLTKAERNQWRAVARDILIEGMDLLNKRLKVLPKKTFEGTGTPGNGLPEFVDAKDVFLSVNKFQQDVVETAKVKIKGPL
jgi:hypothetical protein